jgi:hypothetical protein
MASYTWLMRVASPAAVGTYAFVNPVIALLLGRAVCDDQLSPRTLVAAVLVVAAIVLIQRASTRRSEARSGPDAEVEVIRAPALDRHLERAPAPHGVTAPDTFRSLVRRAARPNAASRPGSTEPGAVTNAPRSDQLMGDA